MKLSWLLVLPILLFSVSAPAQWPDTKEKTERIFRDANLGDPKAQTYLGRMYDNGKGGVPLDHAEAAKWYRKAAEQGHPEAQVYVGDMYGNARGAPLDDAEAAKWYRKAAEQGNQKAQWQLGRAYHKGQGVSLDLAEAGKWYREAARTGHLEARAALNNMFESGERVPRPIAEAEKLHRAAAEQGNAEAQWSLGRGYDEGAAGLPRYLAEAEKWRRKAAEQGLAEAQVDLGYKYWLGIGRPMDRAEAEKWFRKAAEQGNAKAQDYLQRTLRSQESARQRESSETVTWSLFAGIAILALMTIAITKRLRIQTPGEDRGKKRSFLVEISYVLGFVFLFVPGVIWPLMAFPVAAVVPALMTLAVTLRGYWQSPTPGRRMALALVFISTSMWLCFGLYEHQLQKWAQSVVAPIRVDLLVLGPLLYISTLSLFRFWSWTNRHAQAKDT
jgi:TPR repeat protein